MIDHIILFKADNLGPAEEEQLLARLGDLADVPGVVGFAVGKNFSHRSRGFDYCVRVTLADREALERYDQHPIHLDVVAYNRAVTSEHLAVDFSWSQPRGRTS